MNLVTLSGRQRRPVFILVLVALVATVIGAMSLPRAARAADTYVDPLAYTRIDPQAPVVNLLVEQRATRQTSMVTGRRLLQDVREVYVRSADLSTMLKAGRLWQDTLRRLELSVDGKTFVVTGGSRVLLAGAAETLLPVPVLDFDGDLWLPLTALLKVIGPQAQLDVAWDAGSGRLALGRPDDNIEGLGLTLGDAGTSARINCTEALTWSVDRPRADRLEVTIDGGRADAHRLAGTGGLGLVSAVECRQEAGRTIIALHLAAGAGEQHARAEDKGKVIIIDVAPGAPVDSTAAADQGGATQGGAAQPAVTAPPAPNLATPLHRVVIDAGHGGADTGAIGPKGLMEKDVNLAVARELKQYLEHEGDLDVTMTRSHDESLELDARAEIANTAGGELFISLHCNSWFDDKTDGFETFFLSPASSDWARSVAATENGAAAGEPGDVEFIVWELVQNRFITRSSRFAEFLQGRACQALGLPDRGVRQAGFRVLVGAYMPAVLVELGFLSNAGEESRLGDRGYQRQLARAIGDAVLAYAKGAGAAGDAARDGKR